MGNSAQQHRIATGVYLNPGCAHPPKRDFWDSHYRKLVPEGCPYPGCFLLLGAALGTVLTYLVVFTLNTLALFPFNDSVPAVQNHLRSSASPLYLGETRESLNLYFLSVLLYLTVYMSRRSRRLLKLCSGLTMNLFMLYVSVYMSKRSKRLLKILVSRVGKFNKRRGNWFESTSSLVTVWGTLLNLLLIVYSNLSLLNPGPTKNISVLYQNVGGLVELQGLRNDCIHMPLDIDKMCELKSYVYEHHPDIIVLNETWLSKVHADNEILPCAACKIFRLDRSRKTHPIDPSRPNKYKSKGGGVLIAISTTLDVESKKISINAAAEIMSVELKLKNCVYLIISSCYRVGNANESTNLAIQDYLTKIAKRRNCKKHVLVGDFNLNKVAWPESQTSCELQQQMLDVFNNLGFYQSIDRPTHSKGNVLDLLLTNTPNLAQNIVIMPRNEVCSSDHNAICFELGPAKRKKFPKRKIFNFKKANWSELGRELKQVKWDMLLKFCDADTAWQRFKTILLTLCDKHIPRITVQYKFQCPWFDSDIHKICRDKERLRSIFKVSGTPEDYSAFAQKRKEFKSAVEEKMRSSFEDEDDPALISKKLWALVKSTSCTSRIPEVVNYKGKFRNNSSDQAELFNEFFCDQFSEPSHYDINIEYSSNNDESFELSFNHNKIANLLKNMNARKAQGPDGIHGHILKNCAFSLSYPLSLIYKTSYNTGLLPNEWKEANVVPVHKKGTKALVENYRPISLTCLVMKIFELQIRDALMARCSHLLDSRQHGFLPRKSCTTQLVKYVDSVSQILNSSSRADIVFFDFMKAFDSVNHDIILSKLKYQYKIDGRLLKFLVNYLQGRSQRVVINESVSGNREVESGVPQGSILGPLLFVLFINDMFSCVSSGTEIALYADDTKIWRKIESWDDHLALQEDINSLHSWSIQNKMKFHPLKCNVLRVTLNPLEPVIRIFNEILCPSRIWVINVKHLIW